MHERPVFACERSGLAGALLGGYDGSGSWQILIEHVDDKDEHLMVQVHEAMHHELQTSTSFGTLVAMCAELAKRGHRRHGLLDVFDRGVELSTEVHEAYATFLSTSIAVEREARDPLAGNPRYLGYRQRADALLPRAPGISGPIRLAATAAVLRCCMHPAVVADLSGTLDFARIRAADLVGPGPDERLSLFEQRTSAPEWIALLSSLTEADPGHQERILAEHRPTAPDDMELLTRQWAFETAVVQRQCYELTARTLAAQGAPSIPWEDLGAVAAQIAAASAAMDDELADLVRVVDNAPPVPGADVLEFSRQVIRLRDRLPVEVAGRTTASTRRLLPGFVVGSGTPREHVCGLWYRHEILRKQFDGEVPEEDGVALFTRAPGPGDRAVARLGAIDGWPTPQELQRLVAPHPLLALTTHFSLTDPRIASCLRTAEPVHVVMDLPIGWHVDDWVDQGAEVRYAVVTVDADRELAALTVKVDRAPNFLFFHVGGLLALGSLFERLRQRHDCDRVVYDEALLDGDLTGLSLAISHVIHTFHVLDQDAAS